MLRGTEAEKYRVGGDLGWTMTIPPGGAATYASWASKHTFKVDKDTLGKVVRSTTSYILITFSTFAGCFCFLQCLTLKQEKMT
ncbi:putative cupredoxin [Rosa chinensis]|uniref:Putative cupredoxin n=1 Tax=Rosa chinensis TaxID=74649 RepID=A0A2P6S1E8_ROSCH|nr:putative cupredoxin [Rosa chinensis]